MLMAVSEQHGVVGWVQTTDTMNSSTLIQLLRQIDARVPRAVVFMDSCSFHRSGRTLREFGQLNLYHIFNVVRAPQLNPIEIVINMLKQIFKKLRIEQLVLNLIIAQEITVTIAILRLDAMKI